MKLVNLKNTADADTCAPMGAAPYGYGLRIYLDAEQCEALGITKAVKAGSAVRISAQAIVVRTSESVEADPDGSNDVSLDMQITDMGVEIGAVVRNAAQVLYGDDK
jgi:hypothetical protein